MNNRFESLYGYAQRSLMTIIRNELGESNSLTMGILLYNPYSGSFYYESTVKNTLLFPNEINKLFHANDIWDYELMYYLGKYLLKEKRKEYIQDLIEENNQLSKNNASYFAITFDDYDIFKVEWLNWLHMLPEETFNKAFDPNDNELKILLNQIFHFGNYLLTIIKFGAYYPEDFTPQTGSLRENIFRVVIDDVVNSDAGFITLKTAELRPEKNINGVTWHNKGDSRIHYAELALVLEICFKQPFLIKDKIADIKDIILDSYSKDMKVPLAAIGKPLYYNGEFQGVIYVTKNMAEGNFNPNDFDKFDSVVDNFQIENIIFTSRFDTARILLEQITAADFKLQLHPLHKVLNAQHIFSSSPLGIIVIAQNEIYLRCREGNMQTKKTNQSEDELFEFLKKELDSDIKVLLHETSYFWWEIPDQLTDRFNKNITKYFDIRDDLFVKSFVCMRFSDSGRELYYFLFNFNHVELLNEESRNAIKQSYALRMHNNIIKLMDAYLSSMRSYDIQNDLRNELKLEIIHHEKNFIIDIRSRFKEIQDLKPTKLIKSITDPAQLDCDNVIERFKIFIDLIDEQSNPLNKSIINKKEIEQKIIKIKQEIEQKLSTTNYKNAKKTKILYNLSLLHDNDTIESNIESISFCINELVENAIRQYNSSEGKTIEKKEISIEVFPYKFPDNKKGFIFKVFNTGTYISESIKAIAGVERIANGSNNSTGFGFVLINAKLKRLLSFAPLGKQYFTINDKPDGTEIEFKVSNKISRRWIKN